jgi:hypothetical protein
MRKGKQEQSEGKKRMVGGVSARASVIGSSIKPYHLNPRLISIMYLGLCLVLGGPEPIDAYKEVLLYVHFL